MLRVTLIKNVTNFNKTWKGWLDKNDIEYFKISENEFKLRVKAKKLVKLLKRGNKKSTYIKVDGLWE